MISLAIIVALFSHLFNYGVSDTCDTVTGTLLEEMMSLKDEITTLN